jgi:PKD repeat protein
MTIARPRTALLISGLFSLIFSTQAATLNVTTTVDGDVGSLRWAATNAIDGDTVTFDALGVHRLTSGKISIDKSISISGPGENGVIIDGNSTDGIFLIVTGIVKISGLTITHGGGNSCSAVINLSDLTVQNCRLVDNVSEVTGGAIMNLDTLTLKSCELTGNRAPYEGGAIDNEGNLTIVDCKVNDNTSIAGSGGAIFSAGSITIHNSDISNNSAVGGQGGGLYCFDPLSIAANFISGNTALNGGGIYVTGNSSPRITLTDNTVVYNSALESGGGVFCDLVQVTIENCTVSHNSASGGNGGGIDVTSSARIYNSTVEYNSANTHGGGVFCLSANFMEIYKSRIAWNTAAQDGGGLVAGQISNIVDSEVTSNIGNRGGGIYAGAFLTMLRTAVSGNVATSSDGGGIWAFSPTLSSCTISNNYNLFNGAGVYATDGADVSDCVISGNLGNFPGTLGGGMFVGGPATISNTTFSSNFAKFGGGLYSTSNQPVVITNCIFNENTASVEGGGLYGSFLDLEECTVSNNIGNIRGSGVLGVDLILRNSSVFGNSKIGVTASGVIQNCAIYNNGSTGVQISDGEGIIQNCTISGNQDGGVSGSDFQLLNSTVAFNVSSSAGAGVNASGSSVILTSSIVANNTNLSAGRTPAHDIFGTLSTDHCLFKDMSGALFARFEDNIVGVDPRLEPLADNGGLTLTHALRRGSPALDVGLISDDALTLFDLETDQRGGAFPRQFGDGVDIGAFEAQHLYVRSFTADDLSPTSDSSVDFSVEFNADVNGMDASDFVVRSTGTASGMVIGVSGGPAIYTVTVGEISGTGTLQLELVDDDSISEDHGVPLGGAGTSNGNALSEVYGIVAEAQPPTVFADASPSVGSVPLTVYFSGVATTDTGTALTYAWDFGDGSPLSTQPDPVHAYTAAGLYVAELTVTDASGNASSEDVIIEVNPAGTVAVIDSDGDGFSDQIEAQFGSNALNAADRPLGLEAAIPGALSVSKLAIKLDFAHAGKDSISASGHLLVPEGFSIAGKKVIIDVGGVVKSFELDARGTSPKSANLFAVKLKAKKGVAPLQVAPFLLKWTKGDYAAILSDNGLINANVNAKLNVPMNIIFNGQNLSAAVPQTYKATAGKSGRTK